MRPDYFDVRLRLETISLAISIGNYLAKPTLAMQSHVYFGKPIVYASQTQLSSSLRCNAPLVEIPHYKDFYLAGIDVSRTRNSRARKLV